MLRVLEAQAPPKQNATDTINTLSSRLANATLLEDRRGAILGLRSFAKEYPASVASGALRTLISSLTKDLEDIDTGKVVLETLLNLFNPNPNSSEASEDIALWLADEFSQRQENITVLLDLLENQDFYSRLYSLQLLSSISAARPERTQECILSAPLGTTRLVAVLEDHREPVRSAGLVLLNDITHASPELQKLVAFENAFDRIFNIIKNEGSLVLGGIVVQDCLSLLANLLHINAPNQSLFRETGFVPQLTQLLSIALKDGQELHSEQNGLDPAKEKNVWGFLTILRMFLVKGNTGTAANQLAFEKHKVLQLTLDLGFSSSFGNAVKAEALHTCADIVRANPQIQLRFAHNQVSVGQLDSGDATNKTNEIPRTYIIDALLSLSLSSAPLSLFDVRYAACECIQAYFFDHTEIRLHFLNRAIEGHTSGADETVNIITILINGPDNQYLSEPYRIWFASLLVLHLIYDNTDAKKLLMDISEGDAESGEEVVSCIQILTANLIAALQSDEDERIGVAYLMLLCVWLFDDATAVDDFLFEGSTIHTLIAVTKRPQKGKEIIQGLCTLLLGIIYEFSTKDSPMARRTLTPLLLTGLGREQYIQHISSLRHDRLVRDFEVLPQNTSSSVNGSLPDVFFDPTFIDFAKDNFSRIVRAIDRDPGREVTKQLEGIDRDLVDTLRSQLKDKTDALQQVESEKMSVERQLSQEQADHRKTAEASKNELGRIKSINGALQKGHEAELDRVESTHRAALSNVAERHKREVDELQKRMHEVRAEQTRQLDAASSQYKREMDQLHNRLLQVQTDAARAAEATAEQHRQTLERLRVASAAEAARVTEQHKQDVRALEKQLDKVRSDADAQSRAIATQHDGIIVAWEKRTNELEAALKTASNRMELVQRDRKVDTDMLNARNTQVQSLTEASKVLEESIELHVANIRKLEAQLIGSEGKVKAASEKERTLQAKLQEKEEARQAAQTELDDLLILLGDLEEKRVHDKQKIKELGGETSDDEDEDEDEDEGEDEDRGGDENMAEDEDAEADAEAEAETETPEEAESKEKKEANGDV